MLPRIGASITYFGIAVVRQMEQMDIYTPNTSAGIANSRDKLRATQILSRHSIGMPATMFVRDRADVLPAIEQVGGAPVVIKLLEGTQGIGVILAPDTKVAEAVIETLQSTRQNVLIQRFVTESRGRDVRALVVGDRVVAAMRRVAQGDEFRSNVHRGGHTEAVELDEEYQRVAVQAAQIMGLRVAGVDMLEGDDGPSVMEVNSSPGLEGIEAATGSGRGRRDRRLHRQPGGVPRTRRPPAPDRVHRVRRGRAAGPRGIGHGRAAPSRNPGCGTATSPCSPSPGAPR